MATAKGVRRIRVIFLWLLLVSVFLTVFLRSIEFAVFTDEAAIGSLLTAPPVSLVTMISSVVSAIGVIATTIIGWRKERRESRRAVLEEEKIRLENTKLRRELDAKGATEEPPV